MSEYVYVIWDAASKGADLSVFPTEALQAVLAECESVARMVPSLSTESNNDVAITTINAALAARA